MLSPSLLKRGSSMRKNTCKCGELLVSKSKQCRSCARAYQQKRRDSGLDKSTEYGRAWRERSPEKYLYSKAKSGATRRGIPFELELSDINIPERCPVFGWIFEMNGDKDKAPSVDRIDSSRGYTKDNIQIISWRANDLKSDGTLEELEKLVEFLRDG